MAEKSSIIMKQTSRNIYTINLNKMTAEGKKYIVKQMGTTLKKNTIKGLQKLMINDENNVFYDDPEFFNVVTMKAVGDVIKISLNNSVIRKMSKKYLKGDVDAETDITDRMPIFDFTKNFFKNSVSSIENWARNEKGMLKNKYGADVVLK